MDLTNSFTVHQYFEDQLCSFGIYVVVVQTQLLNTFVVLDAGICSDNVLITDFTRVHFESSHRSILRDVIEEMAKNSRRKFILG